LSLAAFGALALLGSCGCLSSAETGSVVGIMPAAYCPNGAACAAPLGFPLMVTVSGLGMTYTVHIPQSVPASGEMFAIHVKAGVYVLGGKYEGGQCSGATIRVRPGVRIVVEPQQVCPIP
jgi:hypothetical protein